MKHVKYLMLLVAMAGICGCSEFFDPEQDNVMSEEQMLEHAGYFTGPLNYVYSTTPRFFDVDMDKLTDNAVDDDFQGPYYTAGIGGMSPANNPLDMWKQGYTNIRQLNYFLSKMVLDPTTELQTPVQWLPINGETDLENNLAIFHRLRGEAYFLRAYWTAELLRNFAGKADGQFLGIPLVGDAVLNEGDDLDLPRAAYEACVRAICDDCDRAIELLPIRYDASKDNVVIGEGQNSRATAGAAYALKARVLLYAASPEFNPGNDISKWEEAARAAGEGIVAMGGLVGSLASRDNYYFVDLNNNEYRIPDILFRGPVQGANSRLEQDNYPRGMYGEASVNPSQNYVDAFPDADGYPIAESATYDPDAPYANRDPRLAAYVGYNGSRMGAGNYYTIETYTGGKDAYNPLRGTSRTNYYLRKTLRTTISLIPGNSTSTTRANIVLGLPEYYLTYAEAANEAWGVNGDPEGYGFTAKDALLKIMARSGTGTAYLNNVIGNDADLFREYVRNERRLELSFEGHYFYDQRRWIPETATDKLSYLNKEVYGISITMDADGDYTYEKVPVETREFRSPYPPIPYSEVFNTTQIRQNDGW